MSSLSKYYSTNEHLIFRESARKFFENEVKPYNQIWEEEGKVPREVWKKFGSLGFLCPWLPEEYGGSGVDFLYSLILIEESVRRGCPGFFFSLHSDVIVPYIYSFGNEEQKKRWLPRCASGDLITAVSITEPDAGSDVAALRTSAVRDGDHYIINGQKTFVSNGENCDMVVLAVKTDPKADPPYTGISLIVVEDGTPGFEKGKKLKKIGLRSQDTVEMSFTDCRVPAANLLGNEGDGFKFLMQKLQHERLLVVIGAQLMAEEALRITIDYTKERKAFGKPVSRFQYISFELAKMATDVEIGRTLLDSLIIDHMEGKDLVKKVSMGKYWISEMLNRVVQKGVQFHGGYGYMEEYPIAQIFRDARVQTIYAGTSEIMLMVISRYLGL